MTYIKNHWQLLLISALMLLLWNTPVMLPFKIFSVFLHEICHGLAAVLTGGSIESITFSTDQGGLAYTRGGSRFAILTVGYLGSLTFGSLLFFLALKTEWDRLILAGLGALILVIALLYIRDLFPFVFATLTGIGLLAITYTSLSYLSDFCLRIIGVCCIIYVPNDIISDTIMRAHQNSDARMLANMLGGPTLMWGVLWFLISLGIIYLCLRHGLKGSSNISFTHKNAPTEP